MTAPTVQVFSLGGFRVLVDGQQLSDSVWQRKKARQLFKCLLTRPSRRVGKYELVELLWPESDIDSGLVNLRSAIHSLRRAIALDRFLFTDRDAVWLQAHPQLWLDADAFHEALSRARQSGDPLTGLEMADALYAGDFLPEDALEEWTTGRRDQLRSAWTGLQLEMAEEYQTRGNVDAAVSRLNRLLQADPGHEPAARAVMTLLAGDGRRAEAIRVYERLVKWLRDELEVGPSEETVQVHASITGDVAVAHATHTASLAGWPRRKQNLPSQAGPLIGRVAEVAAAKATLMSPSVRLLTLVGPAGCGKTRIALQVARELLADFEAGVWFIDLSAERDPERVVFAIGRALSIPQPLGDQSHLRRLMEVFGDAHALLVLDNFEQVVAGGRQVAELLAACPNVKAVVTSREPLHLTWEHEFQVPPLAQPDLSVLMPVATLAQSPAVALFVQRAQAVRTGWRLTADNARAVAELCVRLDGLPLAIELAAARVKLFTPHAMLARMDRRFELLVAAKRDLPPRHQQLRMALEWSHNLLADDERLVFRRTAVFAGGWTIGAAESVCSDPGVEAIDVFHVLDALVDKSLVRLESLPDGEPRFSMLETIREFARSELDAAGEASALSRRHSEWCVGFAEELESELVGAQQVGALELLEREHDNLRAALRWSLDGGHMHVAARLAVALGKFWEVHGYLQEANGWLQALLANAGGVPVAIRAMLCGVAGHVAFLSGELERAQCLHEESLALSRAAADAEGVVQSLVNLGLDAMASSNYDGALIVLQEALAGAREINSRRSEAQSLDLLGRIAYHQRNFERARAQLQESLQTHLANGNGWGAAQAMSDLGDVMRAQGLEDAARDYQTRSLTSWQELADEWGLAYAVEGFALLSGAVQPERTVQLIAAATAARERVGIQPLPGRRAELESMLDLCRHALDADAYTAAHTSGCSMTLDEAATLALT